MREQKYKFYYELALEWYKKGGSRVGKEQIKLKKENLAEMMHLDCSNDPFSGGRYPLNHKRQVATIQELVTHAIDMDQYNYYISARSLENKHPYSVINGHAYWHIVEDALIELEKHGDIILQRDLTDVCGYIVYELLEATGKIEHISSHERESDGD